MAKAHDLPAWVSQTTVRKTFRISKKVHNVVEPEDSLKDITSLSLFPLGSKSLPPAAPPSLYGDNAFFNVCKTLKIIINGNKLTIKLLPVKST